MKRGLILTLVILALLAFWAPSEVPASGGADRTAWLLQPMAPVAATRMPTPTVTPGAPWSWGGNDSGQLGDGTTMDSSVPVRVSGLTGAVAIAAGYFHSLALRSDGTVGAWGKNNYGQLGNASTYNVSTPVQVSEVTGTTAISAGGFHSLALRSDGTVRAWGLNNSGQLGFGSTYWISTMPVQVTGLTGVMAIAAGGEFSLALRSDGTVWAWGRNNSGQLGATNIANSISPVQVSGLTEVVAVAAGSANGLALRSDGAVWAWGLNNFGQLGNNTTTDSATPVQVSGLTEVAAIAAGGFHSLALRSDGTVRAWGLNNSGQLGFGSTYWISTMPVQVTGLTGVMAIAAGGEFSLALRSDGAVWAWGANDHGELGGGASSVASATPVQVSGLTGVAAIAAGGLHSLALTTLATMTATPTAMLTYTPATTPARHGLPALHQRPRSRRCQVRRLRRHLLQRQR